MCSTGSHGSFDPGYKEENFLSEDWIVLLQRDSVDVFFSGSGWEGTLVDRESKAGTLNRNVDCFDN